MKYFLTEYLKCLHLSFVKSARNYLITKYEKPNDSLSFSRFCNLKRSQRAIDDLLKKSRQRAQNCQLCQNLACYLAALKIKCKSNLKSEFQFQIHKIEVSILKSTSNQSKFNSTVFPRIVSTETILFWKLKFGNYSREETIQGRKLLISYILVAETIQGRKLFQTGNYMRKLE